MCSTPFRKARCSVNPDSGLATHTRAETTATNLGLLLLARELWGEYTTPIWCLDAAVAKRAEGKFSEKVGITTLVLRPKQLYLGTSREQKIDFVGTELSGGVLSAGLLA